jgi:hypothetical protein
VGAQLLVVTVGAVEQQLLAGGRTGDAGVVTDERVASTVAISPMTR